MKKDFSQRGPIGAEVEYNPKSQISDNLLQGAECAVCQIMLHIHEHEDQNLTMRFSDGHWLS